MMAIDLGGLTASFRLEAPFLETMFVRIGQR